VVKRAVSWALGRLGYRVIRTESLEALHASNAAAVRELEQLRTSREIDDYQLEMAKYHLRAGTDDLDPEFLPILERCREFTMTSVERLFALYKAVRWVVEARVPGDLVECGVWRGGSMMLVALTLLALGRTDRRLVLYDTFEGLPKPDEDLDVDLWGNRAIDGWRPHRKTDESSSWAYASLDEVRAHMVSTGYPMERVSFEKGLVEKTIPESAPDRIALLRLDTDWYESTRHELDHLFPRLSKGGVLIIDDYGHFRGARRAVDEYFEKEASPILLHRVDYSGRIGLKV
jgi:hypothetical protein